MTEFIVIDGHAPWCAYIRDLHSLDRYETPCDCRGWDDDDRPNADYDYDWGDEP
jgi:hypothetical protein